MRTIEEINDEIENELNIEQPDEEDEEYRAINIAKKLIMEEYTKNPEYLIYLKACKMKRDNDNLLEILLGLAAGVLSLFSFSLTVTNNFRMLWFIKPAVAIFGTIAAAAAVIAIAKEFYEKKMKNPYKSCIFAVAEELEKEEVKKDETYN